MGSLPGMWAWALLLTMGASPKEWWCESSIKSWAQAGLQAPCLVLEGSTPARLAAAQRVWNLTPAQAQCAINGGEDHAAWKHCLEQWPQQPVLWAGTLITNRGDDSKLSSLIAQLPRSSTDGGRPLADQLLDIETAPVSELAGFLLRDDPSRLASLLSDQRLGQFALFKLAYKTLEEKRELSGPEWDSLAPALVMAPLANGNWMFAAELWMRLPVAVRARVGASIELAPLYTRDYGTLRSALALGLIALGQKEEARRIVLPPPRKAERGDSELLTEAAAWSLTGKRSTEAWEAAIALRKSGGPYGWEQWLALVPFLHPHEAMISRRLRGMERWERKHAGRKVEGLEQLLTSSSAGAAEKLKQLLPIAAPASAIDAGTPVFASLPSPFVERTTPWKGPAPQLAEVKATRRFSAIRTEREGKRTVVLAVSQRLDPVGEVSQGGYWLLIFEKDQWKELYLGLGEYRPFHALEKSTVPLLDSGDVVRLAMEDAPIEDATIILPPLNTQAPVRRELVVLEAPLSALSQDTDQDGLSDLVENRLLLDPQRKDTDGDGVSDGDDLTPRLDDRLARTPLAEIYDLFFEKVLATYRHGTALIVPPRSSRSTALPRTGNLDDVRFLVGDAASLAGLHSLGRMITLDAAELEAAQERFGKFYPMNIEVTMNGPDHAYVEWSEGWRGGACRMDRDRSGVWVVKRIVSWIT